MSGLFDRRGSSEPRIAEKSVIDQFFIDDTNIFAAAAGDISKDISTGLCTGSQPNMDFQYDTSIWWVFHHATSTRPFSRPDITPPLKYLSDPKTFLPAPQTAASIHHPTTFHPRAPQQQCSAAPATASTTSASTAPPPPPTPPIKSMGPSSSRSWTRARPATPRTTARRTCRPMNDAGATRPIAWTLMSGLTGTLQRG